MRAVLASVGAAIVVAAGLGGCGLPHNETARQIDASEVPYGLHDTAGSTDGETSPADPSDTAPTLYWIDDDDELVAVSPPEPDEATTYAKVQGLLDALAAGPLDSERTGGLSTGLSPGTEIDVAQISGSTVVVDVGSGSQPPSADRLPLAIGQVVLTATSVAGVDHVVFYGEGQPREVPLPGGALTSQPVTAADYASLVDTRGR